MSFCSSGPMIAFEQNQTTVETADTPGDCFGAAKNAFPEMKTIIGIGMDAPKFAKVNAEDFLMLHCREWDDDRRDHYEKLNNMWNFFKSANLQMRHKKVMEFVDPSEADK